MVKLRSAFQLCLVSHKGPFLVHYSSVCKLMIIISTDIVSKIRLFADESVCYHKIKDTEDYS